MNREIKFRVWNGTQMEYKVMAGYLGAFYVQGMDENDAASMSPFNTKYFPETPLMQFTGLTDKNGKEIYEGDLVKFHQFYFDGNEQEKEWVAEIAYQNGSIWLQGDTEDECGFLETFYGRHEESFEVIGNIYEEV